MRSKLLTAAKTETLGKQTFVLLPKKACDLFGESSEWEILIF